MQSAFEARIELLKAKRYEMDRAVIRLQHLSDALGALSAGLRELREHRE